VRRRPWIALAACSLLALLSSSLPASATEARGVRRPATSARVLERPAGRPDADALTRALVSGRITRPSYALERAMALFHLGRVRAEYGDVAAPAPRDATFVLRDLVLAYDRLSRSQRRVADGLLARPTDGAADRWGDGYSTAEATPYCSTNACFHWVASTVDAPPPTDADADGVPDWVESTASEFETVWSTEIGTFGFRAPKSDLTSANPGPDGRLDVYLAQLADDGAYGYCASDDPAIRPDATTFDASAYCVIDNDFAELGGVPALEATLAHEFFHAVQFAYDITEDRWWMEATATWIEDEVFDAIDDNVQYLGASPLAKPRTPLDSNNASFGVYGDWIFFRFVSELFASAGVHDTSVVRRAWELADAASGGPDTYSIQAIAAASKAAGMSFRELFARFGMDNDVARAWYEEGAANDYPVPPLADKVAITSRRDAVADAYRTKHLTNTYVRFVPRRGVTSSARLVVAVDLPPYRTGSEASVVTISTAGEVAFRRVRLNADGNGRVRVPFGRASVTAVDLVLTNASTRTRCWVDPNARYSCWGEPKDDGAAYAFAAALRQ
jgi:hypothetical protein